MLSNNPELLYPLANGAFKQTLGTAQEQLWAGQNRLMRVMPSSLAFERIVWLGEPVRVERVSQTTFPTTAAVPANLGVIEPPIDQGLSSAVITATHDTWQAKISIAR